MKQCDTCRYRHDAVISIGDGWFRSAIQCRIDNVKPSRKPCGLYRKRSWFQRLLDRLL